ncbi:MAG: tagaturonate epimerase [Thermoanaerobacterium sp.]|nr:tagaturonate epimerase [Thermoanaerobacterium sp.]
MIGNVLSTLKENGFKVYPDSLRKLGENIYIFVVKRQNEKMIGILSSKDIILKGAYFPEDKNVSDKLYLNVYPFTFENYVTLNGRFHIGPTVCRENSSFGTGDRLGLVTAAQLTALKKYDVFPILAQQSPRELIKTNRDFKDVLLKVVLGVLETGYIGHFGADADHIKDEYYLLEGINAGYTMYTLDLSEQLIDISSLNPSEMRNKAQEISQVSKDIIKDFSGKKLDVIEGGYVVSEEELYKSAVAYETAMKFVEKVNDILKEKLNDFDLEISIDEGGKVTTLEDHLFVAEYLHRNGIDFFSIAPKFPGEFEKAIDYVGDVNEFERELKKHYDLTKLIGGYKLSLHSGSDKFSIYKAFSQTTEKNFHIKTSGTSWLQAVNLIYKSDREFYRELYKIALSNLEESKKSYKVLIKKDDFKDEPELDNPEFMIRPEIKQLFHISFGVLLDLKGKEIKDMLYDYEEEHYKMVSDNIENHLKEIFYEK